MSSGFSFYRFASRHSREWHVQQRRRRRDLREGYDGYPVRVEQIASRDNLYECYLHVLKHGGPAPGVDDVRIANLTPSEAGNYVGALSKRILDGTYRPMPTRPVSIPKPGTNEFRGLQLPVIGDRIVGTALNEAFGELWKKTFLPCSYGFRKGFNTWQLLADLEAQMHEQDRYVLAIDDVRKAFDNVPLDAVVDAHANALAALNQDNFGVEEIARTLQLVHAILRGYDLDKTRGICQGGQYSPTALNVLLHETLDVPMMRHADNKPLWFRYADNVVYLGQGVSEGRQALAAVSALLHPLGLSLKGDEAEVVDLSNHDRVQLLGFDIVKDDDEIRYRIGDGAWDSLRQCLGEAHVQDNPSRAALAAVYGWVDSLGPAYESGDVSQVISIAADYGFREISASKIDKRWLAAWRRWLGCRRRSRSRCRSRC
jgi:RNA-directed DNA polymerase